jgi:hypothetical protein
MSSQLKSNTMESDLELEWLFCLASTFQTSQRPHPNKAIEIWRPLRFPRTKNRQFIMREWKKALSLAQNQI